MKALNKNAMKSSNKRNSILNQCLVFTVVFLGIGLSSVTGQAYIRTNSDIYLLNDDENATRTGVQLEMQGRRWFMGSDGGSSIMDFKYNNSDKFQMHTNGTFWVAGTSDAARVASRDWVFAETHLTTDGYISLPGNQAIRRRPSGYGSGGTGALPNGHLSFIGFTEYRFDQSLQNPTSSFGGHFVIKDDFRVRLGSDHQAMQVTNNDISLNRVVHSQSGNLTLSDNRINFFIWDTFNRSESNKSNWNNGQGFYLHPGGVTINGIDMSLDILDGNLSISGSDNTFKNQHIQINRDRISADGIAGTQDLLLTDNNGITLRSNKIILESEDGTATNDVLAIRSTRTNLETSIYGKDGTVTFKDAVFIESTNGLTVAETINAQDLNVTPGAAPGAPDYVFEKNYDLRSLEEVQKHIKRKGHLPEVPSAKEIEEEGYTMVEMDFTLLKKVEELTLYMIELQKRVEKLEAENKKLRSKGN
ncbi:MAG: hypothetical protein AAFY41_03230 [Bacteroidota bacterium]